MDEFAWLDATAQADLVRARQVKPVELVDAAIARIERLNPALNAVITPMFDEARATAKALEPDGGAGGPDAGGPPFPGVPFLLKDLGAFYRGARYTAGSAFLRDWVAPFDVEVVRRFRRAGLVVLGKTNTPEFGLLPTTEPRAYGPTRNPWDVTRTAGGSSGGAAAAVASGMVPVAHASDGGGSIRIPASCCGLFGMKVSRGRNPRNPDFGLGVDHVVTRSVRDSAALLDAIAGPGPGDPYWAPPPARPFREEVGADPGRLRIAFTTAAPTGVPVDPDCVAAVEAAAALCAGLGHEVTEGAPAFDGPALARAFTLLWTALAASSMDLLAELTGRTPTADQFEPYTWALAELGRQRTAVEYLQAVAHLQSVAAAFAAFFTDHDVWLTPTLAFPPPPLGRFDPPDDNPLLPMARSGAFVPFTPVANAAGLPAMSVPLAWNAAGLPIGVHFVGRFGDEATLFRLAGQLEAARPWAGRRPPVSA